MHTCIKYMAHLCFVQWLVLCFVPSHQGLFGICTQPMRDDVTMYRHLSLTGCIHKMIPESLTGPNNIVHSQMLMNKIKWNLNIITIIYIKKINFKMMSAKCQPFGSSHLCWYGSNNLLSDVGMAALTDILSINESPMGKWSYLDVKGATWWCLTAKSLI